MRPEIAQAVERLRADSLVAFPTETVYGLGADALNPQAVASVFHAKGRPASNPLIVHVASPDMAKRCADSWPEAAQRLADAFWPGPLSIIVSKAESIPDAVTASGPGVALRMPNHPVALELINAFAGPIVGPSANPSGAISPTRADHVREAFAPDEVLVLEGGECTTGIESTVVSLLTDPPTVLRPGVIGSDAIAEVLDAPVQSAAAAQPETTASPGLIGPHYQPQTPAVMVEHMADLARTIESAAGPAFVIAAPGAPVSVQPPQQSVAMPADPRAYAAEIYAVLREADAMRPAVILIARPPTSGATPAETAIWHAINDRLNRATAR